MNTTTKNRDTQLFSAMVEILISSILGEEEYGFSKKYKQTTYRELASVMNQKGHTNYAGQPLNKNALKQLVHRVRQKEELMNRLKPDWDMFSETQSTPMTQKIEDKNECLVCGSIINNKDKKLCSSDCVSFYEQHKTVPHNPRFATIFHQMKSEETLSKLN